MIDEQWHWLPCKRLVYFLPHRIPCFLLPCPLSVGIYSDVIVMQDVSTKDSPFAIWAYLGQRSCRRCTNNDRSLSGDAFRNKSANVGRNKNKKANGRSSWTHVSARFCAAGFSHVPICHGKRQISLAWEEREKKRGRWEESGCVVCRLGRSQRPCLFGISCFLERWQSLR